MPDGDAHLDAIATLATLTRRLVDLRGFELNQIKAKVALKVLDIEQLGLPKLASRPFGGLDRESGCQNTRLTNTLILLYTGKNINTVRSVQDISLLCGIVRLPCKRLCIA